MDWKVGDWVILDLSIGQITKLEGDGYATFADGMVETSGRIADRFRPLTLTNKRIVETFDIYYDRLREIDGEAGFNYPDISRHFSDLVLMAIDQQDMNTAREQALQFVSDAEVYLEVIQGVRLFRPNMRRRRRR